MNLSVHKGGEVHLSGRLALEFFYIAFRPEGEERGRLEAPSEVEALRILKERGLVPVELKPVRRKRWFLRRELSDDDVLLFTEHLRQLLEGGLPLDKALNFLERVFESTDKRSLALFVGRLKERLQKGRSLSQALEEETDISRLYVQLIKTGEAVGDLPGILATLQHYLSSQKRFREELISNSLYPLFLIVFGLFAIQTVLVYVLPRFAVVFEEFGTEPPWFTALLLRIGIFWRDWGAYFLLLLGAIFVWGVRWIRLPERRKSMEEWLIRWPYVGLLVLLADLTRVFRALAVMLGGGLSLYRALLQAAEVATLITLRRILQEGAEKIRHGSSLRVALLGLPPKVSFVLDLLSVGEETGNLPRVCNQISRICEERFSTAMTRILKLLEPVSVLGFGLFVGAILLSVLLAIFDLHPSF